MFTQLHTPLPVHVLDKGSGIAFAVIDYGIEHDLIWVTALDEGGEVWCVPNPKLRLEANWTIDRNKAPGPTIARSTDADENREVR